MSTYVSPSICMYYIFTAVDDSLSSQSSESSDSSSSKRRWYTKVQLIDMCVALRESNSLSIHSLYVSNGIVIKYNWNSENFARDLFSQNFAGAKFSENKTLTKWQITLWFTDEG